MTYGYIYEVVNTANGKVYIGQTVNDIQVRFKQHVKDAERGCKFKLHNAIRKYGSEAFTIELLTTADNQDELNRLEQTYIDGLGGMTSRGYNLRSGGSNGKHSEESKRKMSEIAKGKVKSPDHVEKIAAAKRGQSSWNKGKTFSDESKAKMSASMKGRVSYRKRPVIDSDGVIYCSVTSAAGFLGLTQTTVHKLIRTKTKSRKGISLQYY